MNRNAFIGRNVEILFKNSIGDNPTVIDKIKDSFKIDSRFLTAISSGIHGEKVDVKLEFASGHNIDVNVKAYKKKAGFNQLTRTTVNKFCEVFNISESDKNELIDLITLKASNTKTFLFPLDVQKKWGDFFTKNVVDILKWGFSNKSSREILVLYERDNSIMQIYVMKEVLNRLDKTVSFSIKGNIDIGNCVSFQRKGGNGSLSKTIPKNSIKHPGNNVQLKLKVKKFIEEMKSYKIAEYSI